MTVWVVALFEDPGAFDDPVVPSTVFSIDADEIVILPNGFFAFQRKNRGNGQSPSNILILSHESVNFMHPAVT